MGANSEPPARSGDRDGFLRGLGSAVREERSRLGWTRKTLSERASVSERFLAALEQGDGNISVARLHEVALALGTLASTLIERAERSVAPSESAWGAKPVVALLGLRGAGKSAVGAAAAKALGVRFVELDALVEREAGVTLRELFELHGTEFFRKTERGALARVLSAGERVVLATSGGLVTDRESYERLLREATTVWLRARPEEHWERVIAQGDTRPMRDRADAMDDLRRLLLARGPLYERAAHTVDTSALGFEGAVGEVVRVARGG